MPRHTDIVPAVALVESGRPAALRGGRRFQLDTQLWTRLIRRLDDDPVEVSALWSDGTAVHALLLADEDEPLIASLPVEAGCYLGMSSVRPGLSMHERMIRDLWGLAAVEARDLRPLLDHGEWTCSVPLAASPGPVVYPPETAEFPLDANEVATGASQVGWGPVGGRTSGPMHLRLVMNGDRIRRINALPGFAHRGVVRMMRDAPISTVMILASRIDASISVACQNAVALAIERAIGAEVPTSLRILRGVTGALEAGSRGLWSLARLARLVERPDLATELGRVRDVLQDAVGVCFGHRLMFDLTTPGGVRRTIHGEHLEALAQPIVAALEALASCESAIRDSCVYGADPEGDAVGVFAGWRYAEAVRALRAAQELLRTGAAAGTTPATREDVIVRNGEGVGSARSVRGMVHCWIRLTDGVATAFHLHDPGLIGLGHVWKAAEGLRMGRFQALLAAADVVVAGIDQ